jgi:hypothetical protein
MHRAVPVVAATAGGLALLANFHTTPGSTKLAVGHAPNPITTTTEPTPAAAPSTGGTAAPSPTTQPTARRSINGPVVPTRYGDVQVRVILDGNRIVDVQALNLPNDRARSVRISEEAGPLLRQEVLQAQSANIDLVSGASYTSQGYADSLQGALDQARR